MLLYSWAFRSLCSCDLHITPTYSCDKDCTVHKPATTMAQVREKGNLKQYTSVNKVTVKSSKSQVSRETNTA